MRQRRRINDYLYCRNISLAFISGLLDFKTNGGGKVKRKDLIKHFLDYKLDDETHIVINNGKNIKLFEIKEFAGEGHIYINLKDKKGIKK